MPQTSTTLSWEPGGPTIERAIPVTSVDRRYIVVMPVGVKVGPVYATTRGSRRRRSKQYTPMQGVAVLWLIAVVYLLVSGGWWVVLGWTLVAAGLITMCVRLANSKPGVQHAAAPSRRPGCQLTPSRSRIRQTRWRYPTGVNNSRHGCSRRSTDSRVTRSPFARLCSAAAALAAARSLSASRLAAGVIARRRALRSAAYAALHGPLVLEREIRASVSELLATLQAEHF